MRCCICKQRFRGRGHNPEPVATKGKCCDDCNYKFVMPVRLFRAKKENQTKKQ